MGDFVGTEGLRGSGEEERKFDCFGEPLAGGEKRVEVDEGFEEFRRE